MDVKLVQNIRKNMESKSTEELIRIRQENDRTQYSEEAFEAIRQILEERQDIRKNMESKSTEELFRIWQENDRTQYSEKAFEVIRQILEERGETVPPQLPIKKEQEIEGEGGGFFSFRTMISTTLIKIIYALGMIGLTIGGIVMIVQGAEKRQLIGVALIVFGNLLWRIVCEGWILLFSMHDILGSIERHLKRK